MVASIGEGCEGEKTEKKPLLHSVAIMSEMETICEHWIEKRRDVLLHIPSIESYSKKNI